MLNSKKHKELLLYFLGQTALLFLTPLLVGGTMRALGGGGGEMFTFLILNPILICCVAICYGAKTPIHGTHGLYVLYSGLSIQPYLILVARQFVPIYTLAYGLIAFIGLGIGTCGRKVSLFMFRKKEENKSI